MSKFNNTVVVIRKMNKFKLPIRGLHPLSLHSSLPTISRSTGVRLFNRDFHTLKGGGGDNQRDCQRVNGVSSREGGDNQRDCQRVNGVSSREGEDNQRDCQRVNGVSREGGGTDTILKKEKEGEEELVGLKGLRKLTQVMTEWDNFTLTGTGELSDNKDSDRIPDSELLTLYQELLPLLDQYPFRTTPLPLLKFQVAFDQLRPHYFIIKKVTDIHTKLSIRLPLNLKTLFQPNLMEGTVTLSTTGSSPTLILNWLLYLFSLKGWKEELTTLYQAMIKNQLPINDWTYQFTMMGYLHSNDTKRIIELHQHQLHHFGTPSTSSPITRIITLYAYLQEGSIPDTLRILSTLEESGLSPSLPLLYSIIKKTLDQNRLTKVEELISKLDHQEGSSRGLTYYNLMIQYYSLKKSPVEVIQTYHRLIEVGYHPNYSTLDGLIRTFLTHPNYLDPGLDLLDKFTSDHQYLPDPTLLSTLFYTNQTPPLTLPQLRRIGKFILLTHPDLSQFYTRLFYLYSRSFSPDKTMRFSTPPLTNFNIHHDPNPSDPLILLDRPCPTNTFSLIDEARSLWQSLERHHLTHPISGMDKIRSYYLTIHTTYFNHPEAISLYHSFYTQLDLEPPVRALKPILHMLFTLRRVDLIYPFWSKMKAILEPIEPDSILSTKERREYAAQRNLDPTTLYGIYRDLINGFARLPDLDRCHHLLTTLTLTTTSTLQPRLHWRHFLPLYDRLIQPKYLPHHYPKFQTLLPDLPPPPPPTTNRSSRSTRRVKVE